MNWVLFGEREQVFERVVWTNCTAAIVISVAKQLLIINSIPQICRSDAYPPDGFVFDDVLFFIVDWIRSIASTMDGNLFAHQQPVFSSHCYGIAGTVDFSVAACFLFLFFI